ncbi:MAG: redoxin domain-containing protein [Bacteroidetes bacterium]|jgi:peroxiredoxin|nr:redoxin domain-containing protein [Bacteroidota bacterium]
MRAVSWTSAGLLLAALVFLAACAEDPAPETTAERSADAEATDAAGTDASTDTSSRPSVRRTAPDFERPTLAGDTMRRADWEGRVVVLNFWATWCAPCRVEIPRLITLAEAFDAAEVLVVGVSIDEEGREVVAPYAEAMGIPYPLIVDPDHTMAEAYGGHYAVPTTFIIDQNGTMRQRFMRVVAHDELVAAIEPLLNGGA